MADINTRNVDTRVASSGGNAFPMFNAKSALVLSVASIALTGAFALGIGDETRTAINWLMPIGSIAGLLGAAFSLRAKSNHSQAWLAGGTLALASTAAVSSNVLDLSTALVALGAFAIGLAFAIGRPAPADATYESANGQPRDDLPAINFFDEIAEIDRQSKIIAKKNTSNNANLPVGSTLVDRIHIADRPAFLMACSIAADRTQDINVRVQADGNPSFTDMQIILKMHGRKLFAAMRKAENTRETHDVHEISRELAHELRTPLAAMVGFADVLAQEHACTDEMRRTYPGLISKAGRSLIEMTGSILEMQVVDGDEQTLTLKQIAQECVDLLQQTAQQKSIAVFNRVPQQLSSKAVNGAAMRQILTNLISNAIKFSPAGASVELSAAIAANGWTLSVTDNGHGLAPEDVARLGQKNFRSDKAAGIAGYGLGLSIVSRLVDKIGGRISFESRPGKGTQVTVAFPASSLVELSSFQQQAAKRQIAQPILQTKAGEKHAAA